MIANQAMNSTEPTRTVVRRSARASSQLVSQDVSDFLVIFRQREANLSAYEVTEMRRWVQSWLRIDRPCYVVMGCCTDTSQAGRLRRLNALVEQIVACGVPADMVRYTDESIEPPVHATAEELPQDFVWLKAVDLAQAGRAVRSIKCMFDPGSVRQTKATPRNNVLTGVAQSRP